MNTNQSSVELIDLTITFSRWGQNLTALNRVNLKIPKGQWVMLAGHNGSGKSTLLKAISKRLTPNSGQIIICGKQASRMSASEIADHVFHVNQDPLMGTAPKLTLFENLMVADRQAQIEGTSQHELAHKYRKLLEPLGLADRMKQLALYFSGGERQLITLLIARMRSASLLLLDEPLAALDPTRAETCMNIIATLHSEGTSIIQVTHDSSLAITSGDRTLMLNEGRLVYDQIGMLRKSQDLHDIWASDFKNS